MASSRALKKKVSLPRYDERRGWTGGDSRTLYAFTDRRTGQVFVYPGGGRGKKLLMHAGPEADVRVATRAEAEAGWQNPLHAGWTVHATRKQGPFDRPIQFQHNGFTYRTNSDASVVEGHDGKRWNRTHSLAVRDAALSAIELRDVGARLGTWRPEGGYKPPWLVEDEGGGKKRGHAAKKRYPYIAYWVRSRGPGRQRDSVPIYVLGTTTRADEGIVGHDLRVRPLRLGKGAYTAVVSPDDVEDKP